MISFFRTSGLGAFTALLALSLGSLPALAQPSQAASEQSDLGERMRQAFLDDPTIVRDALAAYQRFEKEQEARRSAHVFDNLKETLKGAKGLVPMGNPKGDIFIVEFSDYNCGYCKQASTNLRAVLKADPNLTLYVLEMPIFGQESVDLARLALAANAQGKYEALHWALMEQRGRITTDTLLRIAKENGIDTDQLVKDAASQDVEKTLGLSFALAGELGVSGTPAFIIGGRLLPGALPKDTILELVKEARGR